MIALVRETAGRVAASGGPAGASDPEAIHDFRVALRRLRTALRPARAIFGKRRLREIGGELRRFAQASGALRDEEVLRETLTALAVSPRARAELDVWLVQRARQERTRRRQMVVLLAHPLPGAPTLDDALVHLERRLGRRRHEEIGARALAEGAIAAASAAVAARAAEVSAADVAGMHELRILFKRLRYTAELFEPLLGERAAAIAKRAARMQKRLGELHDLDEALLRISRARTLSEPASAAVRRALLKARARSAERATRDLAGDRADQRG
jgi:CHAD domain-containing protein